MKINFTLDQKITIGELMTVISILVSAISVLITWRNEQNIQILENATRTRVETFYISQGNILLRQKKRMHYLRI